jgi:hypothetical protein
MRRSCLVVLKNRVTDSRQENNLRGMKSYVFVSSQLSIQEFSLHHSLHSLLDSLLHSLLNLMLHSMLHSLLHSLASVFLLAVFEPQGFPLVVSVNTETQDCRTVIRLSYCFKMLIFLLFLIWRRLPGMVLTSSGQTLYVTGSHILFSQLTKPSPSWSLFSPLCSPSFRLLSFLSGDSL